MTFKLLLHMGFPMILMNSLVFLDTLISDKDSLSCCDMFCGVGNVGKSFQEQGHAAGFCDITLSPDFHDINAPEGLLTALLMLLRCKPHGVTHW